MKRAPTVRAEQLKRLAAQRAAEWIRDGMSLGLGTGSTVRHLLDLIAERRRVGEWQHLVCVPTSIDTADRARERGIPLTGLADYPRLDLTVDGADEVDPNLNLVKGLGGALLREKIVATASRTLIIMVDESKLVDRLGRRAPLPVEVEPFGAAVQREFLQDLGAEPVLRQQPDGAAFATDGGNRIFDCRFADGIPDPYRLDAELNARAGILEHGLFLDMATAVVVAGGVGTRVLERRVSREATP